MVLSWVQASLSCGRRSWPGRLAARQPTRRLNRSSRVVAPGSQPHPPDTLESESVDTLRGWFLPEAGAIWTEMEVLGKLGTLTLVPAQQALVENGLREDQWHLPKDQASQPHNELIKRLRRSMAAQRQSLVLLLSILDQVQAQTFNV